MYIRSASRLAPVLMTLIYRPLVGALLIGLVGTSQASADFVSFLEASNDTGIFGLNITLTANVLGGTIGPGTTRGEDLTLAVSLDTWTVTDFHTTYNILESTGAISDLLEVTGSSALHRVTMSFTSDTDATPLVPFANPTLTITETGAPQDVDTIIGYARDPAGVPHDLTLTIQSDAETVPEPMTGLLVITGLGLLGYGWRRNKLMQV